MGLNSKFQVVYCSCSDVYRADQFKKHRAVQKCNILEKATICLRCLIRFNGKADEVELFHKAHAQCTLPKLCKVLKRRVRGLLQQAEVHDALKGLAAEFGPPLAASSAREEEVEEGETSESGDSSIVVHQSIGGGPSPLVISHPSQTLAVNNLKDRLEAARKENEKLLKELKALQQFKAEGPKLLRQNKEQELELKKLKEKLAVLEGNYNNKSRQVEDLKREKMELVDQIVEVKRQFQQSGGRKTTNLHFAVEENRIIEGPIFDSEDPNITNSCYRNPQFGTECLHLSICHNGKISIEYRKAPRLKLPGKKN